MREYEKGTYLVIEIAIEELQKAAILGPAHTLRKVKVQKI
jgi:hypothetical protein